MKKQQTTLLFLAIILFGGCSKPLNNALMKPQELSIVNLRSTVTLACQSRQVEDCTMEFNTSKGTFACACTGSYLSFKENDGSTPNLTALNDYLEYFKKYVERKYKVEKIMVRSAEYQLFDDAEVIAIKYISPETGMAGSVMYVKSRLN